ncbi:hypothetical protein ACHAWF_018742 [Thalassiosira exigua]
MNFTYLLTYLSSAGVWADAFVVKSSAAKVNSCVPLRMGLRDALSRFRKKKEIEVEQIKVGATLPEADVFVLSPDEKPGAPVSIQDVLGNGKAILVGMPGAFTEICTKEHLPGYVQNAPQLNNLGYENIAIVTSNDAYVNDAWAKEVGIVMDGSEKPPVSFLSDADSAFLREIGLVEDMGFGVGVRSKRFVLVADNGVVKYLATDEGMDDCSSTAAETIIEVLTPPAEEAVAQVDVDGKTVALVVGVGLAFLLLSSLGGDDGGSMQAVTPVVKSSAGTFNLLENYR